MIRRLLRRLTRDGLLILDQEQPWLDLKPGDSLDNLAAGSIRYRVELRPWARRRMLTRENLGLARPDTLPKALAADQNGFSLNAAVGCQADEREGLARRFCQTMSVRRGGGHTFLPDRFARV